MRVYEVRPRKDHRGFDLLSDALPFGGLWYTTYRTAFFTSRCWSTVTAWPESNMHYNVILELIRAPRCAQCLDANFFQ
jgi:hypothetical protein